MHAYDVATTYALSLNTSYDVITNKLRITRAAGPGPPSQPRGPGARGYEKPIFFFTVPVLSHNPKSEKHFRDISKSVPDYVN